MSSRKPPLKPCESNASTNSNINFVGLDEQRDAAAFASALQPKDPLLQLVIPAVNPFTGSLDVLLFRGVLLVAYTARSEVIIARGTDLATLRRLQYYKPGKTAGQFARAVAFRQSDGALAAAFGDRIGVLSGWCESNTDSSSLYSSDAIETEIEGFSANTLSWSRDGTKLAAVGDGVAVWSTPPVVNANSVATSGMREYKSIFEITREQMPITSSFELGSISPDGSLIVASALYSRVSWVWALPSSTFPDLPPAQISHGYTGVAALDWKPRGGGNPALMTIDRDGTVRLWVKIPKGHNIHPAHGQGVWIEEVARCPHAESTKRAGAAFLRWGGGGCAEDEVDARATGATTDYFLGSVAPKPSRCVHWILRVAGGNAQAWRVRGLDDRPRAEYARLEPGSGDALHGAEKFLDDGIVGASDGRPSLKDVSIIATRSVAPIPLTTSSQRKAGLVRSYAISNGERLLRSPEPPNPPNVGAVFVLLVRNGNVVIARYDVCPTSNAAAVCRARIGAGHSSPVASLVVSRKSVSARDSRGWLATRGLNGDVLIWRTDVAAGASEPISVTGRLSGPHTAVAFAPRSLLPDNNDALGVFAVDAAFGNLRLFVVKAPEGWRNRRAIQNVEMASMVSTCFDSRSSDPTVNHLYTLPLSPDTAKPSSSHDCVVFGLSERGHVYAWRVTHVSEIDFRIIPAPLIIHGRRMGCATAAATCVEGGNRTGLVAVGGDEGCIRVYAVSSDTDGNANDIHLKEIAFLGERDGSEAIVSGIDISIGGARITATRNDGSITVWERSSSAEGKWIVVLSYDAHHGKQEVSGADVCTGLDRSGSPCLLSSSPSGDLSMFHKPLGTCWEHSGSLATAVRIRNASNSSIAFIGPGFAVSASGCGLTLYNIESSRRNSTSFGADAAGYSPTRSLLPFLFLGGDVNEVKIILAKLSESIIVASQKTISSSTYGAGRGLVPPPPALKIILDDSKTQDAASNDVEPAQEFSIPSMDVPGRSLFATLMARSEVRDSDASSTEAAAANSSQDPMLKLASRLRVVSLAGIPREEQNVLQALAKSLTRLKDILPSLDPSGAKFALIAECYRELMPTSFIPTAIVAFALHSTSSDALMDYFLPKPQALSLGAQRMVGLKSSMGNPKANSFWNSARKIGAGWWLSTTTNAKKLIERIARSEFNRTRNAEYAALWYVALGRNSAVAALFKAQQDTRMAQFFLRNFSVPENRIAASKNAYVLVSKHRLILATAFFILANDIRGALNLVKSRMKDIQLYILLARVLANGEHLQSCLGTVCDSIAEVKDSHTQAMVLWLQGEHKKAVSIASKAESIGNANDTLSQTERSFVLGIPTAVFTLGHVLVMSERPPVRGLDSTFSEMQSCRWKAVQALQVDESPFATLKATFDLIKFISQKQTEGKHGVFDDIRLSTPLEYLKSIYAVSAAVDSVKGRAVAFSGAARSGVTKKSLLRLVEADLTDLSNSSCLGTEGTVEAAVAATDALIGADEVDAAIATILATISVATKSKIPALYRKAEFALEYCLRLSVSRALSHVQCAVSLLHQQSTTFNDLREIWNKTQNALLVLSESKFVTSSFDGLVREFKGTELALRFGIGFIDGDWARILVALKSCESLWPTSVAGINTGNNSAPCLGEGDEANSCSNVSADMVSVEALRHMASNPAVLGISPGLGHRRRKRRAPSMCLIENNGVSAATLPDEARGMPSLSVVANDPFALIRIHPALSSTLCASALAYLATHLASSAAKFEKRFFRARLSGLRNGLSETKSMSGFRLVDAAEELEHIANDAIAGWIPLPPFGMQAQHQSMSHPDVSAGAFVDLWTTLGCLPEYAPSLSEAATVAAAELAAAASHAAVQAAEKKDGGRRMRKRRERKGERVADVSKEGLQHLDTTSDVALHGAYPVRFSSSATGPWSGRGRHATLYKEPGALFRKLCVSCTDPPSVIVATPKGIQEIVPSSYTTMPAGFRSHYLTQAQKRNKRTEEQKQHAFEQEKERDQRAQDRARDDEIISSFNAGFGEGPYLPLSMSKSNSPKIPSHRSALSGNKNAVWRHQVEATALAAHPLRRRFASGGTDGLVRLWDFADPLCLASLREERYGRVSSISFSAYGDRVMGVYSSGHVAIWDDPDNYRSIDVNVSASRRRKARIITAFDNRSATDGIFVDERHTIAVVGDPMAPPVVGASLRVFDTREPNSSFHASWSAQVHDHGESRCIALLEDRVRIVSGGLNGSLSVVDLRTKGCIAELPAHPDEVTCLAVEWPRGRAIVSGCRNGDVKIWDSRTLLQLDVLIAAHSQTRHYWSGSGIGGLVGSYGTQSLALTNRSLISCGGDGVVKIWGPGWSDYDLNVV